MVCSQAHVRVVGGAFRSRAALWISPRVIFAADPNFADLPRGFFGTGHAAGLGRENDADTKLSLLDFDLLLLRAS